MASDKPPGTADATLAADASLAADATGADAALNATGADAALKATGADTALAAGSSRSPLPDGGDLSVGFLLGLLVGEGHFGGDGRQPQVTEASVWL